jgi:hypothetical protein
VASLVIYRLPRGLRFRRVERVRRLYPTRRNQGAPADCLKRNRSPRHYAYETEIEQLSTGKNPGFRCVGYIVPQAGAHLFAMKLAFRENKLSGERFSSRTQYGPRFFRPGAVILNPNHSPPMHDPRSSGN